MNKTTGQSLVTKARTFAKNHKGLCWFAGGLAILSNPIGLVVGSAIGTALYIKQVCKEDEPNAASAAATVNRGNASRETYAQTYSAAAGYSAKSSASASCQAKEAAQARTAYSTVQTATAQKEDVKAEPVKDVKKQKPEINKERLAEQVNAYIAYMWDWDSFSDGYAVAKDDEGTEYVVYFDPATSTVLKVEEVDKAAPSEPSEPVEQKETCSNTAAEEIAKQWLEDNENAIYCLFLDSEGEDVCLSASMLPEERQAWPYICKGLEAYCCEQKKVIKSGDQIIVCG